MESALYLVPVLVIIVVLLSTAIKALREYERAVSQHQSTLEREESRAGFHHHPVWRPDRHRERL